LYSVISSKYFFPLLLNIVDETRDQLKHVKSELNNKRAEDFLLKSRAFGLVKRERMKSRLQIIVIEASIRATFELSVAENQRSEASSLFTSL
jgi:CRISPR/Cas system CMR-associated protein Cmr1 (group 7 of RAMP superfamily)